MVFLPFYITFKPFLEEQIPDSKWGGSLSVENPSLEKMCHGVVGHIDGGVRQGLNEPLFIPWQPGSYGNKTHKRTPKSKVLSKEQRENC